MLNIALALFLLGVCAGSFVNALVWRVHQQSKAKKKSNNKLSILNGRSICPHCRHQLSVADLIPVLSWVTLKGRCRYCRKPISVQYPLVELSAGLIFFMSYVFWPFSIEGTGDLILFITWLLSSIGLLALLIYDYRWLLLPNRIIYPTLLAAVTGRTLYIGLLESSRTDPLIDWFLAVIVASGIFWLIFHLSKGRWIGYGDVRLGLITGTLLATPAKSLLMIFTASILGTIFALPSIINGKRKMTTQIPFGPFLIIACFIVMLFGQSIIDWYLDFASFANP